MTVGSDNTVHQTLIVCFTKKKETKERNWKDKAEWVKEWNEEHLFWKLILEIYV